MQHRLAPHPALDPMRSAGPGWQALEPERYRRHVPKCTLDLAARVPHPRVARVGDGLVGKPPLPHGRGSDPSLDRESVLGPQRYSRSDGNPASSGRTEMGITVQRVARGSELRPRRVDMTRTV